MKYSDLQKQSDAEIASHVQAKREELREVRFGTAGMGSRDLKKVRSAKQEIAWGLTELSARRNASKTS